MDAWSILGIFVSFLLTAVLWLARRQGKKRQEINQIEQQNEELSQDAKIDAQTPRRGNSLRSAWNDRLHKNKTQ